VDYFVEFRHLFYPSFPDSGYIYPNTAMIRQPTPIDIETAMGAGMVLNMSRHIPVRKHQYPMIGECFIPRLTLENANNPYKRQ
jgi:hypothetical protein